jgi:hypothetical protein
MNIPDFWIEDDSGVLQPAIQDFHDGKELTEPQVIAVRDYFKQWIARPEWQGDLELDDLRHAVVSIRTTDDITAWLSRFLVFGIDHP